MSKSAVFCLKLEQLEEASRKWCEMLSITKYLVLKGKIILPKVVKKAD
jgi:hypothetical protein